MNNFMACVKRQQDSVRFSGMLRGVGWPLFTGVFEEPVVSIVKDQTIHPRRGVLDVGNLLSIILIFIPCIFVLCL
jgi:hypothetical protein